MTELEQLHYNDSMTDLAAAMESVGARKFLRDFKFNYPKHFQEILVQIGRLEQPQVAALLKKDGE